MAFDPLAIDVPRMLSLLGIDAEHRGDRWVARCPAGTHPDANPSWDIMDNQRENHSLHICRSCSWGGTSITLVVEMVGVTYEGALAWLEERCMGQVAIEKSVALDLLPSGGFRLPAEATIAPLAAWPETARRYAEDRAITAEQVDRWGLGYAVHGRLAGRILVPARASNGDPLTYTARSFTGSPKRYLNPHRTENAVEGAIFGEWHWPAPAERRLVAVAEGGFNGLAVERVAPKLPIACLFGSLVRLEHLTKLSTFECALLITDPDLAGDRAAEKIAMALARHVRIGRVELPRGTDADSVEPAVLRSALVEAWRKLQDR